MAIREPFVFQGIEMWTGVDLMEALTLISDQDEADDFMVAYADLFDEPEHAIQSVRYYLQIIGYDPDDEDGEIRAEMKRIAEMLDVEFPSAAEVIEPQHTFGKSSYGVKVVAA
jgi:hypothetical protein